MNQTNPFIYASDNKRYHTWNYHLRNHFGHKVFKIALDGGFDCPNRDGTVAHGGCTFCSAAGSGDFAGNRVEPLDVQFKDISEKMHHKWKDGKYIAYFQAFTNTHAPVEELRAKYETVLQQEDVVGLSIATRPDCLPDDVVEYLAELNKRTYLWVELGLQTVHEQTANLINRAHDFQCYKEGVDKLRKHGIRICSHIINGLPQEDYDMMMSTAREVAKLDVQGIKIHLLHLLKGTPMVKQYEKGILQFLNQEEYVNLVCDQLEIIPPEMIVHRITGDGPIDLMVGPMWSVNKWEVLNAIDNELIRQIAGKENFMYLWRNHRVKLDHILPFARILLEKAVQPGDIAVDGTMGNGFDTVFLAGLTGKMGHVYAFDIQSEAIFNTSAKLEAEQLADRCTLFHAGHEQLKSLIPAEENRNLTGAIFNLGYLPGGDKSITTQASTTISAIEQLLELMAPEGIIVLVIYHGHPEGAIERDALVKYVKKIPQNEAHVLHYGFMNQVNQPPFIVAIEKRG